MKTCPNCGHCLTPEKTKPAVAVDDFPDIVPVRGAENMYADFCARVADGRRKLSTGRKRAKRKVEDGADYTWRLAHADLDRFLSHAEVAGHVVRRWALDDGAGQHLVLADGTTVDWSAAEIRDRMFDIASADARVLAAVA